MDKKYKFTSSDAWLLQTIARASYYNEATLKDIIALGDALNHALFSSGELQQGFYHLLEEGWIIWEEHTFSLTKKAKKQLDEIFIKKINIMDERVKIEELINAKPWEPHQKIPEFNPDIEPRIFSLEDYNKAVKEYTEEFWKAYREITAKEEKR